MKVFIRSDGKTIEFCKRNTWKTRDLLPTLGEEYVS